MPTRPPGTHLAPPRVQMAVRELYAKGEQAALERTGVSRETLLRIAGRMPVRRSSIELVARRLGIE